MAERRMFAKTIIDSDVFIDMPTTTRLLYYDLAMRADDDGFINSPKKICRMTGASDDDLKLLVLKKFIIPFESGVVVIKHWKIHNYIRNDRYKETKYKEEKALLALDENNSYTIGIPDGIPNDIQMDTQDRIGKDRIEDIYISDKPSPKPKKHKYGEYSNVLLTDDEYKKLKERFPDADERIKELDEGIALKGYKYKSHYLAVIKWAERDKPKQEEREYVFQKGLEV